MTCKVCGQGITGSHETPFPNVHFYNSPDQPCFFEWLKRQLKIAAKPKK
jgi:hypothetical protein